MNAFKRLGFIIKFIVRYTYDFIAVNLFLLKDMLSIHDSTSPGIVEYPLLCKNEREIALLSILISLPPGTLVLAVKSNPATLYVHGVYAKTPDEFRAEIRKLELLMLRALRPVKESAKLEDR